MWRLHTLPLSPSLSSVEMCLLLKCNAVGLSRIKQKLVPVALSQHLLQPSTQLILFELFDALR